MATRAGPRHPRWAVATLDPGPDDLLLEIGCGSGVAVAMVCERLVGGKVVAIDRSATAISRATKRNAEHVAAGRAVLLTMALEQLRPADVLGRQERFSKVFAMNVNLFWVRTPAKELDLVKRLLAPGGALYLFYGYGGSPAAGKASENASKVPGILAEHLGVRGFATEVIRDVGMVCVVARPQ
ncbi:MAG TPA: class I SAM-dependent methyltransferase [Actinomycetes bacterium]